MAYETKALVKAIYYAIRDKKSVEEAVKIVIEIANAEGVVIDPQSSKYKNQED